MAVAQIRNVAQHALLQEVLLSLFFVIVGFGLRAFGFRLRSFEVFLDPHDPTAGEATFVLQKDGAFGFQHVERLCPELEPENVAFPREQVVVDIHPRHRLQVAADNALGNECGDLGILVAAVLDVVERLQSKREAGLVLPVPLSDLRVEIPAVVVKAGRVCDGLDVRERLAFDRAEADNDIRDLHTGVVDVVLDFDRSAAEAQNAHERIAEGGIAEVPDVRRLVRIDRGVLDDGLPGALRPLG